MIRYKIKWINEKRKKKILIHNFIIKKNNILFKNNQFLKHINIYQHNSKKKIKIKNLCLKKGKYNNNFSILKLSRHYIKYAITNKLIFLQRYK